MNRNTYNTSVLQSEFLHKNKILPENTASMTWCEQFDENNYPDFYIKTIPYTFYSGILTHSLPAWTLADLLNILPAKIQTGENPDSIYSLDIRKQQFDKDTALYQLAYGNSAGLSGSWHDMVNTGQKEELIDCCYDMIILLNKNGWLKI